MIVWKEFVGKLLSVGDEEKAAKILRQNNQHPI
jgi:hypothetical protein